MQKGSKQWKQREVEKYTWQRDNTNPIKEPEALSAQKMAGFVQKGFMSPEVSDYGEADPRKWQAALAKAHGGKNDLETRQVPYRATWVSLMFTLKTITGLLVHISLVDSRPTSVLGITNESSRRGMLLSWKVLFNKWSITYCGPYSSKSSSDSLTIALLFLDLCQAPLDFSDGGWFSWPLGALLRFFPLLLWLFLRGPNWPCSQSASSLAVCSASCNSVSLIQWHIPLLRSSRSNCRSTVPWSHWQRTWFDGVDRKLFS